MYLKEIFERSYILKKKMMCLNHFFPKEVQHVSFGQNTLKVFQGTCVVLES